MTSRRFFGVALGGLAALALGCRAPDDAAGEASCRAPSSGAAVADDDPWRGLERQEIQLGEKLLIVRGSRGVIGCPYLDVRTFEQLGEACAIIPAADTAGMLDAFVTAVTPRARELGIEVGMRGIEALDRIR